MIGIDNKTALHEAVIINNYDIVSLLVNHNANKDLCDKEGKKPKLVYLFFFFLIL